MSVSGPRSRSPAGLLLAVGLASCHGGAPRGQVVATVNGHEITNQDLLAEARTLGAEAPAPILLQRVIARELLAQDAHAQHLDSYPGFPADIARLRNEFLAQRDLRGKLKSPPAPTDTMVAQFIAANPYLFRDRMRLSVDEVRFQAADDLRSIQGLETLDQVVNRLKALNVQFDRRKQQLDTANMPPDLAAKLLGAPAGELIIVRGPEQNVALQIDQREPVNATPEQQAAAARQAMTQLATQRGVDGFVARLRKAARIQYQSGYSPQTAKPPAAAAAPKG